MIKLFKNFLRLQHNFLPIPLFIYKNLFKIKLFHKLFYKYFTLCFDTDYNYKRQHTTGFNHNYWMSKRALYWHYTHEHHNRFTHIFEDIFKNHNYLFKDKIILDFMCGLAPYWKNKTFLDLILLESNPHICKILKKKFPNDKIINKPWELLMVDNIHIDTIFMSGGCLIYLSEEETNNFFKATRFVKNFIFIREGTDKNDFTSEYSSQNYWNCERKLKKYNVNYNNSKIYSSNKNYEKILDYLIFTSS